MKKAFYSLVAVAMLFSAFWAENGLAYFEQYPPYRSKDGQPKHLTVKPLVDFETPAYESKDGNIVARLRETPNALNFYLREGLSVLTYMHRKELPIPSAAYRADLDKNGLDDFIVIYNYRGTGLCVFNDRIEIYLKQNARRYLKISYDTMSAGLEDFVDLNNDGKYEVIITKFYSGKKHHYFTYNIYEFVDGELVNADVRFKGFPKFVWYTDKNNDEDTTHLTVRERILHSREKNDSIMYEEIKQGGDDGIR